MPQAALCWSRAGELTNSLVELLLGIVLKINTKAERRVEGELIRDLKRVRGKESILFRLAEAAVESRRDGSSGLVPVVGEATLRELVRRRERARAPSEPGPNRLAVVVFEPLSAAAPAAAGRPRRRVEQHRPSSAGGRLGPASPLRHPTGDRPLLPSGRDGASPSSGGGRVAGALGDVSSRSPRV